MAEDPFHDVSWLLEIGQPHLDFLGPIRHWSHLKIAVSPGSYWVKGFTEEQLSAPEIKSIPFKQVYYTRDQLLFPQGGKVPVKKLPAALLWSPLERGLPLELPSFNHNYFGISERLTIRLRPSEKEVAPAALLTSINNLKLYIPSAPEVRLKPLSWIILDERALILGKPLLPLPGDSYWQQGDNFLPAGLDWEWPALTETLNRELNPDGDSWLIWDKDGGYLPIEKIQCRPLSISSFRLTIKNG